MTKTTEQGDLIVIRDSKGNVVGKLMKGGTSKETFRALVRKLTNNGYDIIATMKDIMDGKPFVAKLDDGRTMEPQVPSPDTRRQAAQFMWEQLHGRAVDQTKVIAAEEQAQGMEQFNAMSESELLEWLRREEEQRKLGRGTEDAETSE